MDKSPVHTFRDLFMSGLGGFPNKNIAGLWVDNPSNLAIHGE